MGTSFLNGSATCTRGVGYQPGLVFAGDGGLMVSYTGVSGVLALDEFALRDAIYRCSLHKTIEHVILSAEMPSAGSLVNLP